MTDATQHLYDRWEKYHEEFLCGNASRETALAAYDDWLSAVEAPRHAEHEAREGGKLLRQIGVGKDRGE